MASAASSFAGFDSMKDVQTYRVQAARQAVLQVELQAGPQAVPLELIFGTVSFRYSRGQIRELISLALPGTT